MKVLLITLFSFFSLNVLSTDLVVKSILEKTMICSKINPNTEKTFYVMDSLVSNPPSQKEIKNCFDKVDSAEINKVPKTMFMLPNVFTTRKNGSVMCLVGESSAEKVSLIRVVFYSKEISFMELVEASSCIRRILKDLSDYYRDEMLKEKKRQEEEENEHRRDNQKIYRI